MRAAVSLLTCLISGLLLALAFPRTGIWPLAWVALVPWLFIVFTASWPVAIGGSWLAGFAFFASLMYWIAIFGYLPWALAALIEGFSFAATAALARAMAPRSGWRVLAVGLAWVTWEFARGLGEFGVTWGQLGHSQAPVVALAQLAAFGGVPAISFVVIVTSAALAHAMADGRTRRGAYQPLMWAAAFAVIAIALGAAHARLVERAIRADPSTLRPIRQAPFDSAQGRQGKPAQGRPEPSRGATGSLRLRSGQAGSARASSRADWRSPVRVGIAQASLKTWLTVEQLSAALTPQQQSDELSTYARLTRQAAARGAAVVVWPESAVPGYLEYEGLIREGVTSLARELGVWLVVGGPAYEGAGDYNSAYVISPEGKITARYDKVHLVPFGEYVPWRKWLPLLRHYRVRETDLGRGKRHHLLHVGELAVGPMICFESVFPYISRSEANRGAQALVIITNDAWFLRTAAAAQHMQIGRFRAIEEGLYVARGAATGISCFFDPLGRVMDSLPLMKRGVIVADIHPRAADTLYRRVGPVFSAACAGVALAWAAAALARRRRQRGSQGPLQRGGARWG